MSSLNHGQVFTMLLGLGILLATARLFGELAKRLQQPAVLGELLAGVLLGPTVFGTFWPELFVSVFPRTGPNALVLNGFATLAVTLFMLVAGMEVDLSTAARQGRTAAAVSLAGLLVPFGLGFGVAWLWPSVFVSTVEPQGLVFPLFFATALSISALPVIAKTLMDLSLYRTDFGMLVVAAAMLDDLTGWIIFAVVLRLMAGAVSDGSSLVNTLLLTVGSAAFMLTVGRWVIHRILPWVQAHTRQGGVIALALSLALFGAAFTEWVGVHAIFGAFLVGAAVGDSSHLREHTRSIIHEFVSFIFAPLFFASVGLRVNFATHFDPLLVLVVLVVACAGKILGVYAGARFVKLPKANAWAVGFAMNARGAMEIILGLLALQAGIIGERMFVALVVMALVTSMMSGPAVRRLLRLTRSMGFLDYLNARTFVVSLSARSKEAAIAELANVVAPVSEVAPDEVVAAALKREKLMPTGLGRGIAVPNARLSALQRPVVAVGLSKDGVDFDAPDGAPARVVFLLLTGPGQELQQLEIVADIAKAFKVPELAHKALGVTSYTEFLSLMRSA